MSHNLQKAGGVAALLMAATFVVAFVSFLGVLMPAGYFDDGITPAEKVAIIADNSAFASLGYLIPYVAWGLLMVVLVLALYDRLKSRVPVLAQMSTVFGLIWAVIVIASGLIAVFGIRTATELYAIDAAQAASVWVATETVANALGGEAGEVLGGVWLLVLGAAGLKAGLLTKGLNYLALALGAIALSTVVPILQPLAAIYGLGLIVWFVWIGVHMIRDTRKVAPKVA